LTSWFQNRRYSESAQIGLVQIEGYLYYGYSKFLKILKCYQYKIVTQFSEQHIGGLNQCKYLRRSVKQRQRKLKPEKQLGAHQLNNKPKGSLFTNVSTLHMSAENYA
jgi:hypothetical protein